MTAKVRRAERKQTAIGRRLMRGRQPIKRLLDQRRLGKTRLHVQALDQFRLGFGQTDGEELRTHDSELYHKLQLVTHTRNSRLNPLRLSTISL